MRSTQTPEEVQLHRGMLHIPLGSRAAETHGLTQHGSALRRRPNSLRPARGHRPAPLSPPTVTGRWTVLCSVIPALSGKLVTRLINDCVLLQRPGLLSCVTCLLSGFLMSGRRSRYFLLHLRVTEAVMGLLNTSTQGGVESLQTDRSTHH
ncbi:hypothetical protein SRHO_G00236120 [Serrasalmus rhombeus]